MILQSKNLTQLFFKIIIVSGYIPDCLKTQKSFPGPASTPKCKPNNNDWTVIIIN